MRLTLLHPLNLFVRAINGRTGKLVFKLPNESFLLLNPQIDNRPETTRSERLEGSDSSLSNWRKSRVIGLPG